MAKIAFFEVTQDWEKKSIYAKFPHQEIFMTDKCIQDVNIEEFKDIEVLSTFIYSTVTADILNQLNNLKLIATRSTGYDHINLETCRNKQIIVTTVPHYGENTVAEFTFAHLLNISRKLKASIDRVRSGSFSFEGLRGFDLAKKTIGVIGFGNIGQKFAKMCKGFDMEVLAFDVFADRMQDKAKEIGVTFVDLDTIYSRCDILSIHLPLLDSTRFMINKDSIAKMKDGVIILNTSRGELIKSSDLLEAVNSGKVYGAGLDVLEGEALVKDEIELLGKGELSAADEDVILRDHILVSNPKVFVTPHNAFNTQDALERILNTALYNINQYLFDEVKENKIE